MNEPPSWRHATEGGAYRSRTVGARGRPIDWGSVGQMHVCQTIWGSVGGAEPDLVDRHLGELLDLFIVEHARAGGPLLDKAEVERHLGLQVIMAGLGAMMSAPRAILREVPDPGVAADRHDPVFTANETARVQLKITISFLNMWHRYDLGRLLRAGHSWQD